MSRATKNTDDPLLLLAHTDPEALKLKACLVIRTLATVTDNQRAGTLRFLIDESGHSATRISDAANAAGIWLSSDAIQKHRKKGCQCLAA